MRFIWNEEKNRKIKEERGKSFQDIVIAISNGKIISIEDNPKVGYDGQKILVICIDGYIWEVPCKKEYIKKYGKSCS